MSGLPSGEFLRRGHIYLADIGIKHRDGRPFPHYFLIVSKDTRNRMFKNALGVRLTSQPKPLLDSSVLLGDNCPPLEATSQILCHNVVEIWNSHVLKPCGPVDVACMAQVRQGLIAALDL